MKKIVLIVIALLGVGIAGFFIFTNDAVAPESKSVTKEPTSASSNNSTSTTFTVVDVAQHKTSSDCWTIIDTNVYDIRSYIPRHPGGDEILKACGTNGTDLFKGNDPNGREGGHSGSATSQLAELKVGDLTQ